MSASSGWSGHGSCVRSGPEMTLKGVSPLAGKVCVLTALTLMTYAEASEFIEVLEDRAGPNPSAFWIAETFLLLSLELGSEARERIFLSVVR
jgi:hypothetical protein